MVVTNYDCLADLNLVENQHDLADKIFNIENLVLNKGASLGHANTLTIDSEAVLLMTDNHEKLTVFGDHFGHVHDTVDLIGAWSNNGIHNGFHDYKLAGAEIDIQVGMVIHII